MVELSFLRILALATGMLLVAIGLRALRSRSTSRSTIWFQLIGGVLVIGLGIFPSMLNLPTDLFSLGSIPGGRLLTLLIVATALLLLRVGSLSKSHAKLHREVVQLIRHDMVETFCRRHSEHNFNGAIMVVLPCYDEEENLALLLPNMPASIAGYPVSILVVDDGSRDNSVRVAEENGAFVVSHPVNMGGGRALHTGFAVAKAAGASIVVTMDADGQHDPGEIAGLVQPLLDDTADVIIGSRALGRHHAASRLRSIGVRLFSGLISALTGQHITDCASGFRAISTRILTDLRLHQEQYHTAEFIIEACKAGMRISERPITIHLRQHGNSKKGHDVFYGYWFAKAITKSWLR